MDTSLTCKICGSSTRELGSIRGRFKTKLFYIRHCQICRFSYVANPWVEWEEIYSEDYYAGRGADPSVGYEYETRNPTRSIRQYELQGILRAVSSLISVRNDTEWLDFGCGNGSLLDFLTRIPNGPRAAGFEEGWTVEETRKRGLKVISRTELEGLTKCFDVVTAIEVLEHSEYPIQTLKLIREFLKPGGLFFYTTGNSEPFRNSILSWSYLVPEVHISFFEPKTMELALTKAGFTPEFRGYLPGYTEIIRFKILKNLGLKDISTMEKMLPWHLLSRLADLRFQVTAHPIGWAGA